MNNDIPKHLFPSNKVSVPIRKENIIEPTFLVARWLLCLDYSLEQERHEAHHLARERETIARLKKLKMIPLKHETHLVSMDEYEKQGISLPSVKSAQLSKHLKLVLDDLPTLDEQLLDFIEDKHPRQLDSIKRLLQKLGQFSFITSLNHLLFLLFLI